ncbi:Uncharacterised protein [Vibrio cholerae]|nr:Uncharacterised protein [Vibrio cholerae]
MSISSLNKAFLLRKPQRYLICLNISLIISHRNLPYKNNKSLVMRLFSITYIYSETDFIAIGFGQRVTL